jgi:pantetheine-phosphate adenylyltransferase
MERYRSGLVALSADPMTYGHLDLIRQACDRCESVVVLIANNDLKAGSYLFSLPERVAIAEAAIRLSGLTEVRVVGSSGLLVDTYLREGCDAVFRGIRNADDLRYEREQMAYHAYILPELADRIVYLESKEEYRIISSSLVKAFVRSGVDVASFVPMFVGRLLEERISGQYRLGVTGVQASGKTYVSKALAEHLGTLGIPVHVANIDVLLRQLYDEDSPGAQSVRIGLADLFGPDILTDDRKVVRRDVLKTRIFDPGCDREIREAAHHLTAPHVGRLFRETTVGKRGLVLIEWAQLAEMGLSRWTNHDVIVVDSPDRVAFESERGIGENESGIVRAHQWSATEKFEAIYRKAESAGCGTVLRYENRIADEGGIDRLAEVVLGVFPGLANQRRNPS